MGSKVTTLRVTRFTDSTPTALAQGLRKWATEQLHEARAANGEYTAYLVSLDANGDYDRDEASHAEDVLWFYDREHVPVNT